MPCPFNYLVNRTVEDEFKLPTFLREYDRLARQCAAEGLDHIRFLLRLAELELIDRERRMVERRIKEARFPVGQPVQYTPDGKTRQAALIVGNLKEATLDILHRDAQAGYADLVVLSGAPRERPPDDRPPRGCRGGRRA